MDHLYRKYTLTLIALFLALVIMLGSNGGTAVTHAADPILAGCTEGVGDVAALIAAVNQANSDPDESIIRLGENCAYTLTAPAAAGDINGLPLVEHDLILEGNGAFIERSAQAPEFRFLVVNDDVHLTANNLGLYGGSLSQAFGGAIATEPGATLTLNQMRLEDNRAPKGGAIFASTGNNLALNQVHFEYNQATEEGGAIYADTGTSLTLNQVAMDDNKAMQGPGGGIYAQGETLIRRSRFEYNTTTGKGGGIYAAAALIVEHSDLYENEAGMGGGAIYATGETAVTNSRVVNNYTSATVGNGGGILADGKLTVEGSHFAYNQARHGGAIFTSNVQISRSNFYHNAGNTSGGAVYALDASRGIRGTHFDYNYTSTSDGGGGALYVLGALDLQGNYFHRNRSYGVGGALSLRSSNTLAFIANNLWVDNTAQTNIGQVMNLEVTGSGVVNVRHNTAVTSYETLAGGGINIANSNGIFENNILTGFEAAIYDQSGKSVAYSNLYYNNVANELGLAVPGTNSLVANPGFVGAGNYRLAEGSAAIDSAAQTATAQDILGTMRPQGNLPDRGAYEFTSETVKVFNVSCADGASGLAAAITAANRHFGPDVIEIEAGGCLLELTLAAGHFGADGFSGLPAVMDTLRLDGRGATVQREGKAAPFRILEAYPPNLKIENLTIRNGYTDDGDGAGVYASYGTALRLNSVNLRDNLAGGDGGGVYVPGSLTIENSEFSGNQSYGDGGGIWSEERLHLQTSTFLNNSAERSGGSLFVDYPEAGIQVENNVWLGNKAMERGAAVYVRDYNTNDHIIRHNTIAGDGVPDSVAIYLSAPGSSASTFLVANNIVVGHAAAVMKENQGTLTTNTNLYFDNAVNELGATNSANHVLADPQFRNLNGNDARLLPGSPAIDRAAAVGVTVDRNGVARPQGNGYDLGAYEYVENTPPTAAADSYTTLQDTTFQVATPGVLGNDEDADGDPLAAVVESQPAHGDLTLNADGSFTYTPNDAFSGSDSFTYRADDYADQSEPATVTIEVLPVGTNVPPAAAADAYSTRQDTALAIPAPGVLDNDEDGNGDTLTAALVEEPVNGMLALNANGSFTYTPDAGYTGADSFRYRANDGRASSAAAVVTITILPAGANLPPVAFADSYEVARGRKLTVAAPGVLSNDQDGDGDGLTAVLDSQPAHGTLTLNSNGSFSYTADGNFSGTDRFTYRAGDGRARSAPATVTITVRPGGQPHRLLLPVVAKP